MFETKEQAEVIGKKCGLMTLQQLYELTGSWQRVLQLLQWGKIKLVSQCRDGQLLEVQK